MKLFGAFPASGLVSILTILLGAPAPAQVREAWAARYDSSVSGEDAATAMALDSSANIYVTGTSGAANRDYVTLKYGPAGNLVWSARYDGPGSWGTWEIPHDIALDPSGNVLVTGESPGSDRHPDFATVKYDGDGNLLWAERYQGTGRYIDAAVDLAVDGAGMVYVTGRSWGLSEAWHSDESGFDFVTIKYDPSGKRVWEARFDGPAGKGDIPVQLAVDSRGNVFVTGRSQGPRRDFDFATLKYGPDGKLLWERRFEGSGPEISRDEPSRLAIDGSGNVYVSGSSGSNLVIVKYDAGGDQLWSRAFQPPGNWTSRRGAAVLALDGDRGVFASTAFRGPTSDGRVATVLYDRDGRAVWNTILDGIDTAWDSVVGMAPDGRGGVFIAGYSFISSSGSDMDYFTLRYDGAGRLLWRTRHDFQGGIDGASALAVDTLGNAHVTGGSGGDYATLKYSPDGEELMAARFDREDSGSEYTAAMRVGASGNVYVAVGTGGDFHAVKYSAAGERLWAAIHDPGGQDFPWDVALDDEENLYLAGRYSSEVGLEEAFALVKFNPGGMLVFSARYDGTPLGREWARRVAVDRHGAIAVTGVSGEDYATVLYDPDGVQLWAARHLGAGATGFPSALAFDGSGGIAVTGVSDRGYLTLKYDAAGVLLWERRLGDKRYAVSHEASMALDKSENIYVAGSLTRSTLDYAVIKYDPDGTPLWSAFHDGPDELTDAVYAAAVDSRGNLIVTGMSARDSSYDYLTVKFDPTGRSIWEARYDGPAGGSLDAPSHIVLDALDNVYVTGRSWSEPAICCNWNGSGLDFATVKYSATGNEQWVMRHDGPAAGEDIPKALDVDLAGNIYVAGTSHGGPTGIDVALIKYKPEVPWTFIRGECDGELGVSGGVTDAIFLLLYNFADGARPRCLAACDADGNGRVGGQVTDAIFILIFNFLGGPPPFPPFPECGPATIEDLASGCDQPPAPCR